MNMKKSYDEIKTDALQCKTLKEFKKRFNGSLQCARRYGYLNDFTWLKRRRSPNTWTIDEAMEISKRYVSREALRKGNQYAYQILRRNDLLKECEWLDTVLLNDKKCIERAKKYNKVSDLNKNEPRTYQYLKEHNLLKDCVWLDETCGTASNPYWTLENVIKAAKTCRYKNEFIQKYRGAYAAVKRNKWEQYLDIPQYSHLSNLYSVYSYEFVDTHTVYVGLTNNIDARNGEHHGKGRYKNRPQKSPVYDYAKRNSVEIPPLIMHGDKLSSQEAQEMEDNVKQKYIDDGWTVLNKAKTGKGVGSLGNNGIKWTYDACYKEAKKYNTTGQFSRYSYSAYESSCRHGWIRNFEWLKRGHSKSKWSDYETSYNEALKYKTKYDFYTNSPTCYSICVKNGWLKNFTWFPKKTVRKPCKYNKNICAKMCNECKNRKEMEKKYNGCIQWMRKHHKDWLDEMLPLKNNKG